MFDKAVYVELEPRPKHLGGLYLLKREFQLLRGKAHCAICGQRLRQPVWGYGFFWSKSNGRRPEEERPYLFFPACDLHRPTLEIIIDRYLGQIPGAVSYNPNSSVQLRLALVDPLRKLGAVHSVVMSRI